MYRNRKVIVVMPAYNAARTLCQTFEETMKQDIVDLVIVVDDNSEDQTATIANRLPNTKTYINPKNLGYGANQKICYRHALEAGGDIIIMVHPDYQYTPQLIPAMAALISSGLYHCVLGSRILGNSALQNGMPLWKYAGNRLLTLVENLVIGTKLSEFHTGYRAFSRELLKNIPLENNSDSFVFDNQMLAQIIWLGYPIAEITCPTRYSPEASSINFWHSVNYGIGCLVTAITFRLAKMRVLDSRIFSFERL